eukprot:Gb_41732 [translate_table: standard]
MIVFHHRALYLYIEPLPIGQEADPFRTQLTERTGPDDAQCIAVGGTSNSFVTSDQSLRLGNNPDKLPDSSLSGGKKRGKREAFSWFPNLLLLKVVPSWLDVGPAYYEDPIHRISPVLWFLCHRIFLFFSFSVSTLCWFNGADGCAPAHSRMGQQWFADKFILILDVVHWNPNAPPRTLLRRPPAVRHHPVVPAANLDVSA